jgi:hypothetical protein
MIPQRIRRRMTTMMVHPVTAKVKMKPSCMNIPNFLIWTQDNGFETIRHCRRIFSSSTILPTRGIVRYILSKDSYPGILYP